MEPFSQSDIAEITFTLAPDDFPVDAKPNFVDAAQAEEQEQADTPEQAGDANVEAEEQPDNVVSLAEREATAKQMFYDILCGGSEVGANIAGRSDGLGAYKSLMLKSYEPVGRAASDQLFDNLCKVSMFRKMLFKLNENSLVQDWGAVFMLVYQVQQNFRQERSERHAFLRQKYQEKQAEDLKENEGSDLKEKAA